MRRLRWTRTKAHMSDSSRPLLAAIWRQARISMLAPYRGAIGLLGSYFAQVLLH